VNWFISTVLLSNYFSLLYELIDGLDLTNDYLIGSKYACFFALLVMNVSLMAAIAFITQVILIFYQK
jgi:hypothetical protein